MTTTTNLKLNKPDTEDYYDISVQNENMDIIDQKISDIDTISNTAKNSTDTHIANKSNPHSVTKAQVGLSNVQNVSTNDQTPTYTVASSDANLTSGEKLSIAFGKIAKAVSSLISHIANTNNPHSVTKSQVGLGNVPNLSTNNQTPTYTVATSDTDLSSGETLSTAFGKIAKAVNSLINHITNKNNPHNTTASHIGLGNVPNVATNDQTPTYTVAGSNTALVSGEKMNVAFGKIAKAVNSLISHLADTVGHITSAERTKWNNKLDATAKATDSDKLDGLDSTAFVKTETITATGLTDTNLANLSIGDKFTFQNLCNNTKVTFFTNWNDATNFPSNYGSGVLFPCLDARHRAIYYSGGANDTKSSYLGKALQTDGVWSVKWIESVNVEELSKYQLKSSTTNVIISDTAPADTTALWIS